GRAAVWRALRYADPNDKKFDMGLDTSVATDILCLISVSLYTAQGAVQADVPSPFATLAHSLRGRLLLLTAAIVLPTIVLAGYIIVGAHQDERAGLDRRLQDTARALTLALDRQLGQTEAILKTLALSPALTDGDYSRFKAEATAAIPYEGAWIVALAPD